MCMVTDTKLESNNKIKIRLCKFTLGNTGVELTHDALIKDQANTILVIRCNEYNSSIIFADPNDIVYLYRSAEDSPLTYAKLALTENGLQDYVDAMNEYN